MNDGPGKTRDKAGRVIATEPWESYQRKDAVPKEEKPPSDWGDPAIFRSGPPEWTGVKP